MGGGEPLSLSQKDLRCSFCFNPAAFGPKLVQSGYSGIYGLRCPACNRIYDGYGKDRTKEFKEKFGDKRF